MCFVFGSQPLPPVPKLFMPSVACPSCCHANDLDFRFCQKCGYQRKTLGFSERSSPSLLLDVQAIDSRLTEVSALSASTSYSKQKSSLQKQLESFLSSLPHPQDISSACPRDLCRFLVWKDSQGKTKVHKIGCRSHSSRTSSKCGCPVRLAYGTVDSLIGKLRAIFNENGRRGDWDPRLMIGNPASDLSLKRYKKVITAEQLQSRALPKKATPFFINDLMSLSRGFSGKLSSQTLSPIETYCVLRDQAYLKLLFFSGDRPGDLGQVKTEEILRFPDNDGFLFNHTWGKTLRDGSENLFGVRRGSSKTICPVFAIELYVKHSRLMGIDLASGYLFRPTTPDRGIINKSYSSSAAESRFKLYLKEFKLNESHTLHGFRTGCAITLALSGAEIKDILTHVGWKSHSTAAHYMQLSKIMSASSASSRLKEASSSHTDPGQLYRRLNSLQEFSSAFPPAE